MFKPKNIPKSIQVALSKAPHIVGIGPSAWPRVVSGYYFPKFSILCSNDCQDNELIRAEGIPVYSQKQIDKYVEISPITPGNIISTDMAKDYLKKIKGPFKFLIYKSMGRFEKVCSENGWGFIGNTMEIRDKYENKKIFKEIIREIGIRSIPGDNLPISEIDFEVIKKYQKDFKTKKLVLQIAEATWGGGSGTFFIENEDDFNKYKSRVDELYQRLESTEKRIETVNIAPYIVGVSASIPCCATKFGTYTGSIQTQLVDVPEVGAKLPTRSGVFAGHDWAYKKYSKKATDQADMIGKKFGDFIYKNGYRGIFGLDLIVDDNDDVWPVECNPRETDAFPLITMLQMEKGAVPMQVFHNLEHLDISYEVDFKKTDAVYKENYNASQILIYNKETDFMVDRFTVKAGVYRLNKNGGLEFVRPGFATWHMESEDEFLLTEDVAKQPGSIYDPHERMLRLIRKGPMLNSDGSFRADSTKIVDLIYNSLGLVSARLGYSSQGGLNVLNVKRVKNARKDTNIKNSDMVNTVKDNGLGIRRPHEISWRMKLNSSPTISQIASKRARKQIVSDSKKLDGLGIRIEIKDEINKADFENWLNLYNEEIKKIKNAEPVIGSDWFAKKLEKNKKVGAIFAYRKGTLIGGELITKNKDILQIGYGVSKKVAELTGGLMLQMDYSFLEFAKAQGVGEVSFGQDTNLYGTDLSAGLILYKTKIGFMPVPSKKTFWVTTYITKMKKIKKDILIFGSSNRDNNLDTLFVVTKDKRKTDSILVPKNIKHLKTISLSEFVSENRILFKKKK